MYYVCMNSFRRNKRTTRVSIMRNIGIYTLLYLPPYTFHTESCRQFPHIWNRINLSLRVKIIYEDNRKL